MERKARSGLLGGGVVYSGQRVGFDQRIVNRYGPARLVLGWVWASAGG